MLINLILNLALGVLVGFILEFVYRSQQAKKIVWPEFINIFMYGIVGVCLVLLYYSHLNLWLELILLLIIPSLIEFLTGYIYLKFKGIYLWDYSQEFLNFRSIICMKFSLAWFVLAALYYYFIFPKIFLS
ncbi:MAG: hypothetical protein KBD55_00490 [Candidatus Pacebacteria bacterium]|nr:hypothetical protein [Candidatus Paceibacterota bacterium]MBP9711500.1 hypothetical protein [Candidatus Paceibacterota bacterium]